MKHGWEKKRKRKWSNHKIVWNFMAKPLPYKEQWDVQINCSSWLIGTSGAERGLEGENEKF